MRFIFLFTILLLAMSMSDAADCFCTADFAPVCATNGRTYGNICRMSCEGAQFLYNGECGRRI